MVTLLEPRGASFVDTETVIGQLEPKVGYKEWRYTVPFAGVKYYAFKQVAPIPAVAQAAKIAPRLIDERVILL